MRAIQICTALVARSTDAVSMIIDDLPRSLLDATALGVIRGLARAATVRGVRLVFTNQRTG